MPRLLGTRFYYGWVMVASAFAINAVSSPLNPVVFSFLIGPMSEDLGVGRSALAWALTLRLATSGFMGPVMGVLIDRYGTRVLGVACGLGAGAMLFAVGFADQLWVVYVAFALSGLAGLGGPAGQLLTQVPLAKWFIVRRGKALSIATIGMATGTVGFVMVTGWLVEAVGWRGTTMIYGVLVAAVVAPVSAIFVRRSPEDIGLHPDGAAHAPVEAPAAVVGAPMPLATTEDWTVSQAMRTSTMWLLLVALIISGMSLMGTLVYRTDFWRSTGISPGLVAFGTALDPFVLIFALFGFGFIADRFPVRYFGVFGLVGFALSVVPMLFADGHTSAIFFHNVIWGIAASGNITMNSLVWPNYFGRKHLGAIRGLVLPVTIAAQGLGAPLFGYLFDAGVAPSTVWWISIAAFGVAALLVLIARPPRLHAAPREFATTRGEVA